MKFRLVESVEETDNEGNVLSPEQIEFFKNSKVRDRSGKLLVCYHNTNADFDTFDKKKIGSGLGNNLGRGFYFTPHKRYADYYKGKFTKAVYLNATKLFNINDEDATVSILVKHGFNEDELRNALSRGLLPHFLYVGRLGYGEDSKERFNELLREEGYDGIVCGIIGTNEDYVVFEPNQIKSITNKNPSNSNNINESTSPASIDEETFKDAFSEPMNTLYGSKDMGMDVVCERLYYDYGIDATYHGATIYVRDKKLCTLRFSHEGRNLWGIYEIRTYIDGLKKVYTVHDFFE